MHSAFVFPGQGSQSVSMLAELSERFPQVQQTFSEASEALGYDLWSLVQNGPETELNQTDKTQPAMLAAGIAVWRCWEATSQYKPAYLAGHSLGEYTALVAAQALDFKTAIKLVEKRGQLMQQAVPSGEGAMAAILGLDDDVVKAVCQKACDIGVVEAVNFNSPGQVVIAGTKSAVDKAVEIATEKGAKRALLLPVSVPSHCALMRPAAEELLTELESVTLQAPQIPVIHNTSVSTTADPDEIRQLLAQQLYNPVRWVETVEWLAAQGVDTLVECGPGKVLAGLSKRIDKSLQALPVFDSVTLQKTQEALGE
ncbi:MULTISPECIES: ACP S-malonyltransferase [unclassified Methylophaga]|uniref:ACP S-malonyltransferase n=1 Tax=unclassified Methylophaga TaxID=2629249 RepID=UPI000C92401F|nr:MULTISPECIES: ACP S-malonyltransferase [unclassified Methylophaga]MAK65444.1 [acyl-carrier-protein] S-malonyltransferase [Methylophaga sp.]MAY16167.1 [acyl-carrier-protein] S-malonyltransferase [Methylophaga sp.]HAO25563.1 [acyl-carrier-protein] S-malonyltransferase [Methylophaga sp.]HCD03771.1 [acyl-carrier-protein] S-malonyltransferase [Methylophaga sp.]|tara:strand:+ start:11533 stop:12468 length:936 start_codon:yes stop_codon:yes gene_type:complete